LPPFQCPLSCPLKLPPLLPLHCIHSTYIFFLPPESSGIQLRLTTPNPLYFLQVLPPSPPYLHPRLDQYAVLYEEKWLTHDGVYLFIFLSTKIKFSLNLTQARFFHIVRNFRLFLALPQAVAPRSLANMSTARLLTTAVPMTLTHILLRTEARQAHRPEHLANNATVWLPTPLYRLSPSAAASLVYTPCEDNESPWNGS